MKRAFGTRRRKSALRFMRALRAHRGNAVITRVKFAVLDKYILCVFEMYSVVTAEHRNVVGVHVFADMKIGSKIAAVLYRVACKLNIFAERECHSMRAAVVLLTVGIENIVSEYRRALFA